METKIIGNKISEARRKINLSQAQLSEQLFISPQAVGKWERGESLPDIITFSRLAKILGVDLNYFSEDFPSITGETTAVGEQPVEKADPSLGKQKNKLSWDMSRGNWSGADFSGLKGLHEKFSSSNMQRCQFIGSDLSGLLLKSNNIESCDFSESDLSESHLQHSFLGNNNLTACSLRDADFSGTGIQKCNFTEADFTGATFKSSSFRKNTVTNAVFLQTSFHTSDIADTVFDGTIEDCSFENCSFARVTFQNATLLNTFFKGPSLKKLRFVDCRADRLTYEFLKNGKADLSGITLID